MRASPGCPLRTLRAAMEAGAGCRRRGSGALTPLVLVLPLLAALSGAASQGTDGSGAVFAINGRGFNETEALRVLGPIAIANPTGRGDVVTASIYLAGDYNAYTQDVLSRGAVAGFEDLNQASTDATLSKWHPEISSTPSNQDNEYVPEEGTLAEYTWPEGGALEEWVADEQLPAPEFSQAVDENERDTVFKVADLEGSFLTIADANGEVAITCPETRCVLTPNGRDGRYILARNGSKVTFENITFNGFGAKGGGAVLLYHCNAVFINCVFVNNTATDGYAGGAVTAINSTATFENCLFSNNRALPETGREAGGLEDGVLNAAEDQMQPPQSFMTWTEYLSGRQPQEEVMLSGQGVGGALAVVGSMCEVVLNSCTFVENRELFVDILGVCLGSFSSEGVVEIPVKEVQTGRQEKAAVVKAASGGGAIFQHEGSLRIVGSEIHNNLAAVEGGALYSVQAPNTLVSKTQFSYNVVTLGCGGSLALHATNAKITNSSFVGDAASLCGGAVVLSYTSNATILETSFSNSTAAVGGGVFSMHSSALILQNCQLSNSKASGFGGSVAAEGGSTVRLTNTTCSNASAALGGGHLALASGARVAGLHLSLLAGEVGINNVQVLPESVASNSSSADMGYGGSAVLMEGAVRFWCSRCRISGNSHAEGNGDLLLMRLTSSLSIEESRLDESSDLGGGAFIHATEASFASLYGVEIISPRRSVCMRISESNLVVENSTLAVCMAGVPCQENKSWQAITLNSGSQAVVTRSSGILWPGSNYIVEVAGSGEGTQVYMSDNSGISYMDLGGAPSASCYSFVCNAVDEILGCQAYRLLMPDSHIMKLEALDVVVVEVLTEVPVSEAGQCPADAFSLCSASNQMDVDTCDFPPTPPPQDAPYIWWMTLTIIGTVCLFTLLGAVLYAHRKGWLLTFVEHGDLSSINGPQKAKNSNTSSITDVEEGSPRSSSSPVSQEALNEKGGSPDSDDYIVASSVAKGLALTAEHIQLIERAGKDLSNVNTISKECGHIDTDVDFETEIRPNLRPSNLIGSGGYGEVYKMKWRGRKAAVKVFPGGFCGPSDEQYSAYLQELELVARFQDIPQIVSIWGACVRPPNMALVYELVEGGSLAQRIHHGPKMTYPEILKAGFDIALGLSRLHPTVVHRDLKPGNILVGNDGTCKLTDFGLSRGKDPYASYISTEAGGTPNYMPPEMFDGSRFDEKVDIYSLGLVLCECITGSLPWASCNMAQVIFQISIQRERPKLPESTPWPLQRLIRKCWSDEPFKRPSAHEVARALQFMLEDHISRGFPPSQFHDEVTPSSSEATDASKGSSDLQARTQMVLAAAAAASPQVEEALRTTIIEAGMDRLISPFEAGANSPFKRATSVNSRAQLSLSAHWNPSMYNSPAISQEFHNPLPQETA